MTLSAPQELPSFLPQTNPTIPAEPKATPEQVVDALHGVFGCHRTARAIHAKGIVFDGIFTPSAAAASLSEAPHLQQTPVPVVVRFSNFSGAPTTGDLEPTASPRGMALRFRLPDGSTSDLVAHSFNGFPTRNVDDFRALFIALKASPEGTASPSPLETFFATHPAAKAFMSAENPPPVSYGSLPYYGVNSFKFINREGSARFVRYRIEPSDGAHFLSPAEKQTKGDRYLAVATRARLQSGPIRFTLRVQLAEQGDVIEDPSLVWTETRQLVSLGVISIERAVDDNEAAERARAFDPAALPVGIELADPMVRARSAAYLVSQQQRSG